MQQSEGAGQTAFRADRQPHEGAWLACVDQFWLSLRARFEPDSLRCLMLKPSCVHKLVQLVMAAQLYWCQVPCWAQVAHSGAASHGNRFWSDWACFRRACIMFVHLWARQHSPLQGAHEQTAHGCFRQHGAMGRRQSTSLSPPEKAGLRPPWGSWSRHCLTYISREIDDMPSVQQVLGA